MRSVLSVAVLLGAIVARPARSQVVDSVLIGVTAVDAVVLMDWDDRMSATAGKAKDEYMGQVRTRFTLELRKIGVIVEGSANTLACKVQFIFDPVGLVAYRVDIEYFEPVRTTRQGRLLYSPLWMTGSIGLVGRANLEGDSVGRWCAERFGNAWLAANPPRR